MVVVTRKYQVTIPRRVREELKIKVGDDVVFVRQAEGGYRLVRVEDFVKEFCEGCEDIGTTIEETRKGLGKGIEEKV